MTLEELKEQTDMYLAYLPDDGYVLQTRNGLKELYNITIFKEGNDFQGCDMFKWDDISDYLLPYIEILEQNYDLLFNAYNMLDDGFFRKSTTLISKEHFLNVMSDNGMLWDITQDMHLFGIALNPKKITNIQKLRKFIKNKILGK